MDRATGGAGGVIAPLGFYTKTFLKKQISEAIFISITLLIKR